VVVPWGALIWDHPGAMWMVFCLENQDAGFVLYTAVIEGL